MSVKISNLTETTNVGNNDFLPVARLGQETFKTPARQFATNASNLGSGPGEFFISKTPTTPTTLQFRTLSAIGENLSIATIGNTVVVSSSAQNPVKTSFTGNGTTRIWPLIGFNSINAANYRVDFDGVLQEPFTDYSISLGNIEFVTAPPLSAKVVIVSNNMVKVNEVQPSPNTITNSMLTDNSVSTSELSAGSVTPDKLAGLVGANTWRLVTSNFSINPGDRIGVNTTSASITGTLPSLPLSGTIITLGDTSGTWGTNNLTINGNGQTILGDSTLICNISNKYVVLFYTGTNWSVFI